MNNTPSTLVFTVDSLKDEEGKFLAVPVMLDMAKNLNIRLAADMRKDWAGAIYAFAGSGFFDKMDAVLIDKKPPLNVVKSVFSRQPIFTGLLQTQKEKGGLFFGAPEASFEDILANDERQSRFTNIRVLSPTEKVIDCLREASQEQSSTSSSLHVPPGALHGGGR